MELLFDNQNFSEDEVIAMPITTLAFVGDAFFTLFARTKVLNKHAKSGTFHTKATALVNAHSQSEFLDKIKPNLTETEQDIVRRARNTHTSSKSKNSGLADYKRSTAFEALLGYLFLSSQFSRLSEILAMSFDGVKL